jgi:hypothetical protein
VSRPPSAFRRQLGPALVAAMLLAPAVARGQAAWLRDRLDVEWVVATGGWRSAITQADARAPGFDALAGGGEFVIGLDVGAGLAVVGDGRVLAGEAGGPHTFFEALASLALQLRLGRVRLRAGPAAGQEKFRGDVATLVGGFAAGSIDLFPLGPGRLSTTLSVRLDVDADVGATMYLPEGSVGLALGLGVRY